MIIARRNHRTLLMYAVDIHVEQGDLSRKMSAMRIWLDEHRFEPSTFSCRDTDDGTLVCIEFKVPCEAEAFAERFDGRANGRPAVAAAKASALSPFDVVA
jgi:hypothetical protein